MDQLEFIAKAERPEFLDEVTKAVKAKHTVIEGKVVWSDDPSKDMASVVRDLFGSSSGTFRRVFLVSLANVLQYEMGYSEGQADWLEDRILQTSYIEVQPDFKLKAGEDDYYINGNLALIFVAN